MSYTETISSLEELDHFKAVVCSNCGATETVYRLQLHDTCKNCQTRRKVRGFGAIGSELEDVIDAVLEWMGEGELLQMALARKKEIDSS